MDQLKYFYKEMEDLINEMLALCWDGPTIADVEDVLAQESSFQELVTSFEIH